MCNRHVECLGSAGLSRVIRGPVRSIVSDQLFEGFGEQDKDGFNAWYGVVVRRKGIQMKTSASLYEPLTRIYKGLPELHYQTW